MPLTHRISIKGVYFLESANPHFNPIAIRVKIHPPHFIVWEDTNHERGFQFSKILFDGHPPLSTLPKEIQGDEIPQTIEATSETGELYKLVKLTVKIFNQKLKNRVAGGKSLDFKEDSELQEYYLTTNFSALS